MTYPALPERCAIGACRKARPTSEAAARADGWRHGLDGWLCPRHAVMALARAAARRAAVTTGTSTTTHLPPARRTR